MAALACEICGGKLIMCSGGIAVCDNCGMEYRQDRIKEMIQEIRGVVQIDNSNMIDNWMKMGNSAANVGNYKEAYNYFTKVVEVDPQNWRAIFEKGEAAAYQSTPDNLRTEELRQGITTALDIIEGLNMPDDEVAKTKNYFANAVHGFILMYGIKYNPIRLQMQESSHRNRDDFHKGYDVIRYHIYNVWQLDFALSLIADLDDELSKNTAIRLKKEMCFELQEACEPFEYKIEGSSLSRFGGLSSQEKASYLDEYWKFVAEIRVVEPEFKTGECSLPDPFDPGIHSNEEIYNYWKKIEDEKKACEEKKLAKKRFDDYWKSHSEEKKEYENRLSAIADEIAEIKQSLLSCENNIAGFDAEKRNKVPAEAEVATIRNNINELVRQCDSLGIFQGKIKKELREQIEAFTVDLENAENTVICQKKAQKKSADEKIAATKTEMKQYTDKISELEKEQIAISAELNKAR